VNAVIGRRFTAGPAAALAAVVSLLAAGPAAGFEADVAPDRAPVGERTCFRFAASERAGTVRFLGKRARVRDGEARICAKPRWPGVHTAWISRGERQPAKVEVHAEGAPTAAGGSWHRFVVHYDAYGDWGTCSTNYGDADKGSCRGTFQGAGWNATPPFDEGKGFSATFSWGSGRPMSIDLRNFPGTSVRASGFVAGPESGALTITGGSADSWYPLAWGWEPWPPRGQESRLQSGTDPAKLGQPGGPIRIGVSYRSGGGFSRGYTVDLYGWIWY
jgi:hypothetical protein